MNRCVFCEIINGNRRNEEIIYENDEFIVLTDKYRKTSAGAICLIIPKEHKQNILELTEHSGIGLIKILNLVGRSMQTAFNCKGIRIWTAINKEAGQSIFHCHIHVVPCNSIFDRFIASFPGIYDAIRGILTLGKKELKQRLSFELAEKIRDQFTKLWILFHQA